MSDTNELPPRVKECPDCGSLSWSGDSCAACDEARRSGRPTPPLGDTPAGEPRDRSIEAIRARHDARRVRGEEVRRADEARVPTSTPVSEGTPTVAEIIAVLEGLPTAADARKPLALRITHAVSMLKRLGGNQPTPSTDAGAGATMKQLTALVRDLRNTGYCEGLNSGQNASTVNEATCAEKALLAALTTLHLQHAEQVASLKREMEIRDQDAANVVRGVSDEFDIRERAYSALQCEHAEQAAKIVELEAELATIKGRRFPIMDGPSIPWLVIAPHERQANINHDQTLERLAQRGGLCVQEALCVLTSCQWRSAEGLAIRALSHAEALLKLQSLAARSSPSGGEPV